MAELEAPFPYFGGKSAIADTVWQHLGDVPNFIEAFFGSGAVLLGRPSWHKGHIETVNDIDGMISNFWRAVQGDPEQTASHADWPVNENDLHARHSWLVGQKESLQAKLEGDPDYYDARIAGYWVWGMCCWIGSGFCSGKGPWAVNENNELVLGKPDQGINRSLVHLGDGGKSVTRKLVHLSRGRDVNRQTIDIYQWFDALAERLRRVRVCCGDWSRIMGPSPTFKLGLTAVFLDPPYSQDERAEDLYSIDENVARDVRGWCLENGDNPLLRIALCGYEGEHEMPESWTKFSWKAHGGYGSQGNGRGRENSSREVIWFSPACLKHEQLKLGLEKA